MLEWTAALCSILGVWLMARRRLAAWPVGLLSVALYGLVFAEAKLYSDTLLQIAFGGFLVYGWLNWRQHAADEGTGDRPDAADDGEHRDRQRRRERDAVGGERAAGHRSARAGNRRRADCRAGCDQHRIGRVLGELHRNDRDDGAHQGDARTIDLMQRLVVRQVGKEG